MKTSTATMPCVPFQLSPALFWDVDNVDMEMDDVFDKAKHIEGYITLAKDAIPISAKDFGLISLKQRARVKDAEGTDRKSTRLNSSH